jgi:hypothetical protein
MTQEVTVKKLAVAVFLIFTNCLLMASWVAFGSGDDQLHINATQSSVSGVSFTMSLNGIYCEQLTHDGVTYQRISFSMDKGMDSIIWNGTNERGSNLASGVYFYKLRACGREETGKVIMIR